MSPLPALSPGGAGVVYDGSFAGWLSVVFDAYRRRAAPAHIAAEGAPPQGGLFGPTVRVETTTGAAERVARGLARRIGESGVERLYHAFLSEVPGIEGLLFRLVARVLAEGADALDDACFSPALAAERLAMRVRHEVHRMHAFVRFERRVGPEGAERYVAMARPEHNVLPLLGPHFEARYPALHWAIADGRRGYALLHTPAAERAPGDPATRFVPAGALEAAEAADEAAYQALWRTYYRAVTIPERRNLRLHLRHVPRRYWPYLTEKRPVLVVPHAEAGPA